MTTRDATEQALLAAVLSAPKDDTPRLQYADWLEENGQEERAEFIRVQLALACRCDGNPPRYAACVDTEAYVDLVDRMQELLNGQCVSGGKSHACYWFSPFDEEIDAGGNWYDWTDNHAWTYRRGFVNKIRFTLADWLRHGPAIVRQQPVERVEVTDRQPYVGVPRNWGWYTWAIDSFDHSKLPRDVFAALEGFSRSSGMGKHYPEDAAARAALSEACLRLAKGK